MNKNKNELPLIGKKGTIDNNKISQKTKTKIAKEGKFNNIINNNKVNKLINKIEESGLPIAFNIIFAELISKQITPDNFFTYTAYRLKEIGQEIEELQIKEPLYIQRPREKVEEKRLNTEGDNKVDKKGNIFMTIQKK